MQTPVNPSHSISIDPFTRSIAGRIRPPGSKSISNRALILAALNRGTVRLERMLFSRDTELMIAALQHLGFEIKVDEDGAAVTITGHAGEIPVAFARIDVGNAGTAARFLTAICALRQGGEFHFDGDEAMRKRPMAGLLDALAKQGTEFEFLGEPGHFPFVMRPQGLKGGEVVLDARASSQLLSALLMVAPSAREAMTITLAGETVSRPFVDMTLVMIGQFGGAILGKQNRFEVYPGSLMAYPDPTYAIEPDATAASYWLALPVVTGGQLEIEGLDPWGLQGDAAFIEEIRALGVEVNNTAGKNSFRIRKSTTDNRLPGWGTRDYNAISDTFLTAAAIAPLLASPTKITGIAHTRKQETDRVSAMATELRKLGIQVDEGEDWLEIQPDEAALKAAAARGVTIDTYEDHRIAMSFAILGCADLRGDGTPWLTINDPMVCRKTYPNFFAELERLWQESHVPSASL